MNSNAGNYTRRQFIRHSGVGLAALSFGSTALKCMTTKRRLKVGYTFITWGYNSDVLEPAVKSISELGFHAFETFGRVIQDWENNRGTIKPLMEKYDLPLYSMFCMRNVLDASIIKEQGDKLVEWGQLVKKYGGKVVVFTGNGGRGKEYNYKDHLDTIVKATNEYARRITDLGLTFTYHQHTGTPIETQEEVYALMDKVDTSVVKMGPDIGQLQKGGADPVKIVKDFLPLIKHVHLKDFIGEKAHVGYAPLGLGTVKLMEVLEILEQSEYDGMIMAELDYGKQDTVPPHESAKISKEYLAKLGYQFRS